MSVYLNKAQKNKNRQVIDSFAVQRYMQPSALQFIDNRPEAIMQRKLQPMAHNNLLQKQVKRFALTEKEPLADTLNPIQKATLKIPLGKDDPEKEPFLTYLDAHTINLKSGAKASGILLLGINVPEVSDRNKKYGTVLMTKFMKEVVGGKPCVLEVKAFGEGAIMTNDQLKGWYAKFGFSLLGTSEYNDPVMGVNIGMGASGSSPSGSSSSGAAAASASSSSSGGAGLSGMDMIAYNYGSSDSDSDTDEKKEAKK